MQEVKVQATQDGELIIALCGELHSVNAEEFLNVTLSAYEKSPLDLTFDCKELNFLDSTALGTFVKIFKTLKADGKKMRLINLQAKLKKLFVICSLDTIMEIA
jgi:anti-sigma B factor antagonist